MSDRAKDGEASVGGGSAAEADLNPPTAVDDSAAGAVGTLDKPDTPPTVGSHADVAFVARLLLMMGVVELRTSGGNDAGELLVTGEVAPP